MPACMRNVLLHTHLSDSLATKCFGDKSVLSTTPLLQTGREMVQLAAAGMGGSETDGGVADDAEALLTSEHGIEVAIEVLRRALQRGFIEDVARITDRLLEAHAPSQSSRCSLLARTAASPANRGAEVGPGATRPGGATLQQLRNSALDGVKEVVLELVLWQLDGAALARCAGVCRGLSLVARDGHRWRTLVCLCRPVAHTEGAC